MHSYAATLTPVAGAIFLMVLSAISVSYAVSHAAVVVSRAQPAGSSVSTHATTATKAAVVRGCLLECEWLADSETCGVSVHLCLVLLCARMVMLARCPETGTGRGDG
jgi:hypothetical protein